MFVKPSASHRNGVLARGALAIVRLKVPLADTDALRRDFHQFVVGNEFDRVLERQGNRRGQYNGLILAGRADVGQLLGLDGVDHQVILAAVNADDDAFVEFVTGAHEQPAALLQCEQRVRHGFAVFIADQYAVVAIRDLALDRGEAIENVADEAGAARQGHELALETDQPARRYPVIEPRAPGAFDRHVGQFRAAFAQRLHDPALMGFVDIHGQGLERLEHLTIDDLLEHLRLADRDFVAFAAHVFDQDGEVQFAAPEHPENIRIHRVFDPQRDVTLQFAVQ